MIMERIYNEIKELVGNKYDFFSLLGYVFWAFNIYLSISLLSGKILGIYFFAFILFLIFIVNFVFSSITSLYIDMQSDIPLRSKEIFYFYGLSSYISFLLIPLVYLFLFTNKNLYLIFLIGFFIWILRVWFVKKKTSFGVINSMIAVFFPHIIIFVCIFAFVLTISLISFIYLYG